MFFIDAFLHVEFVLFGALDVFGQLGNDGFEFSLLVVEFFLSGALVFFLGLVILVKNISEMIDGKLELRGGILVGVVALLVVRRQVNLSNLSEDCDDEADSAELDRILQHVFRDLDEAERRKFACELVLNVSDEVFDNFDGLCERGLYLDQFTVLFVSLFGGSFEFLNVFSVSSFQSRESVGGFIDSGLT